MGSGAVGLDPGVKSSDNIHSGSWRRMIHGRDSALLLS